MDKDKSEKTENTTKKFYNIEELKGLKRTDSSIFSGVCAAYGWKPGKQVTEVEYNAAIEGFSKSPIGRKVK